MIITFILFFLFYDFVIVFYYNNLLVVFCIKIYIGRKIIINYKIVI